jgi:predicted  nucleic acid-binding Zn-ribbon protein
VRKRALQARLDSMTHDRDSLAHQLHSLRRQNIQVENENAALHREVARLQEDVRQWRALAVENYGRYIDMKYMRVIEPVDDKSLVVVKSVKEVTA